MMLVAVSQRVDVHPGRGERRDALDQRWADFLAACGLLALPLPNRPEGTAALLERCMPAGVLLTGGNDLAALGGDAPERDATEAVAIRWARQRRVPVVGVCRGMQMIAHAAGGGLRRVDGHVAADHPVAGPLGERVVNSYHGWAVDALPAGFEVAATAPDGVIEAFRHADEAVAGLMWHPERRTPFDPGDVSLFRQFFGVT